MDGDQEENLEDDYDSISGGLGNEGSELNHKFKSDLGGSERSSKDDSKDPSESIDPLVYSDTEEAKEAMVLMDSLREKITNTLHHAWDSQKLSCQALVVVLSSVLSEVSGDWWGLEMLAMREALEDDMDEENDRGF